jgi:hypothetical protein
VEYIMAIQDKEEYAGLPEPNFFFPKGENAIISRYTQMHNPRHK